jgi:mRNA interferase RelE/StbE
MSYTIVISKSVQKQIDILPSDVQKRIVEKIQTLVNAKIYFITTKYN